jgi:hypothetical protein
MGRLKKLIESSLSFLNINSFCGVINQVSVRYCFSTEVDSAFLSLSSTCSPPESPSDGEESRSFGKGTLLGEEATAPQGLLFFALPAPTPPPPTAAPDFEAEAAADDGVGTAVDFEAEVVRLSITTGSFFSFDALGAGLLGEETVEDAAGEAIVEDVFAEDF